MTSQSARRYNSIAIHLASPETIREWARPTNPDQHKHTKGEVTKPETINYRTFKPERHGLFCEAIFGPVKDWECYCGKYKRVKNKDVVCERCGVEVTKSDVRRRKMGYINLAAPVAHIWFCKSHPNYLSLLTNLSPTDLKRVIYYEAYLTLDPGNAPLEAKQVISSEERKQYLSEGYKFRAETGAEAVKAVLEAMPLEEEIADLEADLRATTSKMKSQAIRKRLSVLRRILASGNDPSWMVLEALPVMPPELRPLVALDGGRFATSDLNDLYRRVINRNNRLKKLAGVSAPEVIMRNERRMLQEAVDALIENSETRGRPVLGPGRRPLKSLDMMLKGKGGRFRQNLLGKRVDYSGRSVIVVGPELELHQCGLPKRMALELFKPFIIRKLQEQDLTITIKRAKDMVEELEEPVWEALEEVIQEHPVLLNRAPTLHRLGIQAFQPHLVEGSAIRIHPLVCSAFNADFDGDQMAVHVPLSPEAQIEAKFLMLSTRNILKPAHGNPVAVPELDMVLGCNYLTKDVEKDPDYRLGLGGHIESGESAPRRQVELAGGRIAERSAGIVFANPDDALYAYNTGKIGIHEWVNVRIESEEGGAVIETTPGRVLFNQHIPKEMLWECEDVRGETAMLPFINREMKTKELDRLVSACFDQLGNRAAVEMLDHLKDIGFQYSTISGLSLAITDFVIPVDKAELRRRAEAEVQEIQNEYEAGAISDGERYNRTVAVWAKLTEDVQKHLFGTLQKSTPDQQKPTLQSPAAAALAPGDSAVERADDSEENAVEDAVEGDSEGAAALAPDDSAESDSENAAADAVESAVEDAPPVPAGVGALVSAESGNGAGALDSAVEKYAPGFNPEHIMADSGARARYDQMRQISGMRGLMAKPDGSIIETPIFTSLREGLSVLEFFISTHGARKGLADTAMQTAKSGYLTRKLVDVAQDVVVTEEDCGTTEGVKKTAIDADEEGITLGASAFGRVAAADIVSPSDGAVLVTAGELVTAEKAAAIDEAKVFEASFRSPLNCEAAAGICRQCYGADLSSHRLADIGEAVGIIAAQSIGEPGTQLTMRTFHTGGAATAAEEEIVVRARAPKGKVVYRNLETIESQSFIGFKGGRPSVVSKESKELSETWRGSELHPHRVALRNGALAVADEEGRVIEDSRRIYAGWTLLVEDGQEVEEGDPLYIKTSSSPDSLVEEADIREAVGIIAAQSTREGIVVRARAPKGKVVYRNLETKKGQSFIGFKDGGPSVVSKELRETWRGSELHPHWVALRNGALVIEDEEGRVIEDSGCSIYAGWTLLVEDGQEVKKGEPLYMKTSSSPDSLADGVPISAAGGGNYVPILAIADGSVRFQDVTPGETVEELIDDTGQRELAITEYDKDIPRIEIVDGTDAVLASVVLPTGALLSVRGGDKVSEGDVLARMPSAAAKTVDIVAGLPRVEALFEVSAPKDPATITQIEGEVSFEGVVRNRQVIRVTPRDFQVPHQEYKIRIGKHLQVQEGDYVEAGDQLTDGLLDPRDLLEVRGREATQKYMVREIKSVYRSQGERINDKHVEVIIRQMMRKVRITDRGDTDFLEGDQPTHAAFRRENTRVQDMTVTEEVPVPTLELQEEHIGKRLAADIADAEGYVLAKAGSTLTAELAEQVQERVHAESSETLTLEEAREGVSEKSRKLAADVTDADGNVLAYAGTKITKKLIDSLKKEMVAEGSVEATLDEAEDDSENGYYGYKLAADVTGADGSVLASAGDKITKKMTETLRKEMVAEGSVEATLDEAVDDSEDGYYGEKLAEAVTNEAGEVFAEAGDKITKKLVETLRSPKFWASGGADEETDAPTLPPEGAEVAEVAAENLEEHLGWKLVSDVTGAGPAVAGSVELVEAEGDSAVGKTAAFSADKELANGSYNVSAAITDSDGNAASAAWTFTVQAEDGPSAIAAVSSVSAAGSTDATLSAEFSDDSTVERATFSVDGGDAQDGEIADNSRANLDVTGLSQGEHTAVVTAVDSSGKTSSVEYRFVVEADPTAPAIVSDSPTAVVSARNPVVAVAFTDAAAGVSADGVSITVTSAEGPVLGKAGQPLSKTMAEGIRKARKVVDTIEASLDEAEAKYCGRDGTYKLGVRCDGGRKDVEESGGRPLKDDGCGASKGVCRVGFDCGGASGGVVGVGLGP